MAGKILTGSNFDKLTVIRNTGDKNNAGYSIYECQCECGNSINLPSKYLLRKTKTPKSCGCISKIDLVGEKFGRLTVIKHIGSTKDGNLFTCQCDCGNMVEKVSKSRLITGNTKSCGCLKKDKETKALQIGDKLGDKFGKLTVIKHIGSTKDGNLFTCQCDCGNMIDVSRTRLITGNTKSCGCLRIERLAGNRVNNMLGLKIGKLTVIKRSDERNSIRCIKWVCQCDCGNLVTIAGTTLRKPSLKEKSCGLCKIN